MNNKMFFKDILSFLPEASFIELKEIPKTEVLKIAEEGSEKEFDDLQLYLEVQNEKMQVIKIENLTDTFFHKYYSIRSLMKKSDKYKSDELRHTLVFLHNMITELILLAAKLKIEFSVEFVSGWKDRTDYFPYGDLMVHKNRLENAESDLSIINNFIPAYIDSKHVKYLKEFFSHGKSTKLIPIIKSAGIGDFINLIIQNKDHISTKYDKSIYKLISKNFTYNGKAVVKTTISNKLHPPKD